MGTGFEFSFRHLSDQLPRISSAYSRSFLERVARTLTFEDEKADITVSAIEVNRYGGIAKLDVTPGVGVMVKPEHDLGYFVIVPRNGSLEDTDNGLTTSSVTALNAAVLVSASVPVCLTINHHVSALLCWVESAFFDQWRTILGFADVVVDKIITDVSDRDLINLARCWELRLDNAIDDSHKFVVDGFPALIAHCMLEKYHTESSRILENHDAESIVEQFRLYIISNISGTISIAEFSKKTGIKSRELTSAVKTFTGNTPYKYVLKLRIKRAHEMLIGSNKSLAEISYSLGFSSQAHLTAMFTRVTGKSPGRYRKEAQIIDDLG